MLQKRGEICNTIKSLGGDISELGHYDDSATHVVCNNPSRNEKVLSSMAAGKWIVHADFVQKSGEQGKFLPVRVTIPVALIKIVYCFRRNSYTNLEIRKPLQICLPYRWPPRFKRSTGGESSFWRPTKGLLAVCEF